MAAIASPAAARDGSGYAGIEAGIFIPQTSDVDRIGPPVTNGIWADWLDIKHDIGYDADVVAGYFVPAVVLIAVITFIAWALFLLVLMIFIGLELMAISTYVLVGFLRRLRGWLDCGWDGCRRWRGVGLGLAGTLLGAVYGAVISAIYAMLAVGFLGPLTAFLIPTISFEDFSTAQPTLDQVEVSIQALQDVLEAERTSGAGAAVEVMA